MIIGFVFFAHLIFSAVVFTKKWQDDNISSAFINVALIGILFTVGWTIFGMIAKVIMEPTGFGPFFDRDAFSLALLSVAEYFFYKMYYSDIFSIQDDKEKQ
ncbi:MAG: hypothetical protein AB9882_05785 [Ignavibacteriaceae bacterium]